MGVLYDNGSSSESYRQFKSLVNARDVADVKQSALRLISFLEVGSIDRGSVDTRAKYKSCNQRWYKANKGSYSEDIPDRTVVVDGHERVGSDALVELRYKRGERETKEHYSVLWVF